MRERKKWWLLPVIVVMLVVGHAADLRAGIGARAVHLHDLLIGARRESHGSCLDQTGWTSREAVFAASAGKRIADDKSNLNAAFQEEVQDGWPGTSRTLLASNRLFAWSRGWRAPAAEPGDIGYERGESGLRGAATSAAGPRVRAGGVPRQGRREMRRLRARLFRGPTSASRWCRPRRACSRISTSSS